METLQKVKWVMQSWSNESKWGHWRV